MPSGLPHYHCVVFIRESDVPNTPELELMDTVISAEIPNDPELRDLVLKYQIHYKCKDNPDAPCMRVGCGSCNKGFPKDFKEASTCSGKGGIPRRRKGPKIPHAQQGGLMIDNRDVGAYNKKILTRYQCNMNIQMVYDQKVINYLFE